MISVKKTLYFLTVALTINSLTAYCEASSIKRGWGSWYSYASTRREGTSGVMANGRRMDDHAYTAASWDYPFGTHLYVCNQQNAQCVETIVSDRGPTKKLVKRGRIIDLSVKSFQAISPLTIGVIPVTVEVKQ